jgi:anti-sigma B factor antagonist
MSTTDHYRVIQPTGVLTIASSPQVMQEFKECLEANVKIVLVDLQNLDFIDSSGLGTLVSMHTKIKLAGGRLYLCSPKDQARSLFDISDMDRILEIYSNREEFYIHVVKKNMAVIVQ